MQHASKEWIFIKDDEMQLQKQKLPLLLQQLLSLRGKKSIPWKHVVCFIFLQCLKELRFLKNIYIFNILCSLDWDR